MKKFVIPVIALLVLVGMFELIFQWCFCRIYVPAGHMAIVTAKTGKPLPPGQILAAPGEKGIRREPLTEGRHFLNPINYDWKIVPNKNIPIGSVGLVISKTGNELPPGEILAPDELSKGVWKNVLGPGTYRLNPEGYEVKELKAINIPIGYAGVVTSQTGKPSESGSFAKLGEKGVMEQVLQPGLYYINPRAYQVDVVEIGMNQVSIVGGGGTVVLTKTQNADSNVNGLSELQKSTIASQAKRRSDYLSSNSDLGMMNREQVMNQKPMAPPSKPMDLVGSMKSPPRSKSKMPAGAAGGKAFAAELEDKAVPMSDTISGVQATLPQNDSVAFGMDQFVQFPSSDGFSILIDMTVEFELLPQNISRIYMLYGDLPAVVSKIILPQILSISRMRGSGYKAREFIDGEGRLKFQKEMTEELVRVLGEKHILVRNAIVRHVEVPKDILAPLQDASIAKEQDLTNKTKQETAKKQAELNIEMAMVDQSKKQVEQETQKLSATILAETQKEVAMICATSQLQVAQIKLDRAKLQAKIIETRGEAEAKSKYMVENEMALGEQLKSAVFRDTANLAEMKFVEAFNTNATIRILHSGEGTLWTDINGPKLTVPAAQVPVKKEKK